MCVCVYGGYSDIFLYTYSDHFWGFKILNFIDFWSFRKMNIFWSMKMLWIFLVSHKSGQVLRAFL